jgi:hypothetical protein
MKWTVVYLPAAERELTGLWIDPSAREGVTDASNRIDRMLEKDADRVGESREEAGQRILFVAPLAVLFHVSFGKSRPRLEVHLIKVWLTRKTAVLTKARALADMDMSETAPTLGESVASFEEHIAPL